MIAWLWWRWRCSRGRHRWSDWRSRCGSVTVDWAKNYTVWEVISRRECVECLFADQPVSAVCWEPVESLIPSSVLCSKCQLVHGTASCP